MAYLPQGVNSSLQPIFLDDTTGFIGTMDDLAKMTPRVTQQASADSPKAVVARSKGPQTYTHLDDKTLQMIDDMVRVVFDKYALGNAHIGELEPTAASAYRAYEGVIKAWKLRRASVLDQHAAVSYLEAGKTHADNIDKMIAERPNTISSALENAASDVQQQISGIANTLQSGTEKAGQIAENVSEAMRNAGAAIAPVSGGMSFGFVIGLIAIIYLAYKVRT